MSDEEQVQLTKTVWKFGIPRLCFENPQGAGVWLPKGAQILNADVQTIVEKPSIIAVQAGKQTEPRMTQMPVMWALVPDTEAEPELRFLAVTGTGTPFPDIDNPRYISTFSVMNGQIVLHLFEHDTAVPEAPHSESEEDSGDNNQPSNNRISS